MDLDDDEDYTSSSESDVYMSDDYMSPQEFGDKDISDDYGELFTNDDESVSNDDEERIEQIPQPFPELPLEIEYKIIEQVRDRKALNACSLVCRAWRNISQRCIHAVAYVNAKWLDVSMYSHPQVASYVHELEILEIDIDQWVSTETAAIRGLDDPERAIRNLFQVISRFHNITRITFVSCNLWLQDDHTEPREILRRLVQNVTYMSLQYVSFSDLKSEGGIIPFLIMFPRLSKLNLSGVGITWLAAEETLTEDDFTDEDLNITRRLEYLHLGGICGDNDFGTAEDLVEWFQCIPVRAFHPNFKLKIEFPPLRSVTIVPDLVRSMRGGLKRLRVGPVGSGYSVDNWQIDIDVVDISENVALEDLSLHMSDPYQQWEWVERILRQALSSRAPLRKLKLTVERSTDSLDHISINFRVLDEICTHFGRLEEVVIYIGGRGQVASRNRLRTKMPLLNKRGILTLLPDPYVDREIIVDYAAMAHE